MKKLLAWLIPFSGMLPGAPSSEESYQANLAVIDAVANWPGSIDGSGTWSRTSPPHANAEALYLLAQGAAHDYLCPFMFTSFADMYNVLDTPSCWDASAASVVSLATTDWDAPWDGVMYGHEGQDPAYKVKLGQYLAAISAVVRAAGLPFVIGQPCAVDGFYDTWLLDLDDVAASADLYVGWAYDYKYPSADEPFGAYWWAEQGIRDAIAHGIEPENMYLGFPTHSKYYPDVDTATREYRTYEDAAALVEGSGGTQSWVEENADGLVRETRGTVGSGSVWISDARMTEHRLNLADQYGLLGTFLFTPGMEDPAIWPAIEAWKWPAPPTRLRRSGRKMHTTSWRKFVK